MTVEIQLIPFNQLDLEFHMGLDFFERKIDRFKKIIPVSLSDFILNNILQRRKKYKPPTGAFVLLGLYELRSSSPTVALSVPSCPQCHFLINKKYKNYRMLC